MTNQIPYLNKSVLKNQNTLLQLPEKVLQFGTGVLLRGLPDYFIHRANEKGIFNGRIVVVKSTNIGGTEEFTKQDNLFTHITRGKYQGEIVNEHFINTSISRVLIAKSDWAQLLKLAESESIEVVISNTTEAGLVLDESDELNDQAPASFPAKLLSLLYTRWKYFKGNPTKGWVILPTELVPENGKVLNKLLHELVIKWQLPESFKDWLQVSNTICDTLVDRIVPGILSERECASFALAQGYQDELLISSEPFALWAIGCENDNAKKKISFTETDSRMVVATSIVKFRELKLRLLNGTHTFCCAVAILAGFETVVEAMNDKAFYNFIQKLVFDEIATCLESSAITINEARDFGANVLERFSNPFIAHKWNSIALNFEEKMVLRNQYLINKYIELNQEPAENMCIGFAAFKIFMKQTHERDIDSSAFCVNQNFISKVEAYEAAILQNGMKKILGI